MGAIRLSIVNTGVGHGNRPSLLRPAKLVPYFTSTTRARRRFKEETNAPT